MCHINVPAFAVLFVGNILLPFNFNLDINLVWSHEGCLQGYGADGIADRSQKYKSREAESPKKDTTKEFEAEVWRPGGQ